MHNAHTYVCTYAHVWTQTCTHKCGGNSHTDAYTHAQTHKSVHACMHTCTHAYTHAYTYEHMHAYMHACTSHARMHADTTVSSCRVIPPPKVWSEYNCGFWKLNSQQRIRLRIHSARWRHRPRFSSSMHLSSIHCEAYTPVTFTAAMDIHTQPHCNSDIPYGFWPNYQFKHHSHSSLLQFLLMHTR